jgi:hypothetical protein
VTGGTEQWGDVVITETLTRIFTSVGKYKLCEPCPEQIVFPIYIFSNNTVAFIASDKTLSTLIFVEDTGLYAGLDLNPAQ